MKFEIAPPYGNLKFTMEEEDREAVQDLVNRYPHDGMFLRELLVEYTGWSGNGQLFQVNPEDVAALTDAPIVSNDVEVLDNGDVLVRGDVWWYPQYEGHHFGQVLLDHGHVYFTAAPTVPESAHTPAVETV